MKKIYFLFVSLFFCTSLFSQNILYSEDFEGVPNATWINNDMNTSTLAGFSHVDSAWIVKDEVWYLYANAAGSVTTPNKAICSTSQYSPTDYADDWLIFPQMVLPSNCYFMWDVRGYRTSTSIAAVNSYKVWVSTTGTTVPDYTDEMYSTVWPAYEWYHHYTDLSAYAGQNVSVAIQNFSINAYMLAIDNIKLVQLENYDVAGVEVSNKIGVEQGTAEDISGTLRNFGAQTITSMDLNYRINGGTIVTENITGLNVAPMEFYEFSHGTPWVPASTGSALIEVWASNINGQADMINSNDIASKTVEVYEDITLKRPLYEDLSSKECSPCVSWNNFIYPFITDAWKANEPDGDISALYYQMSFPGTADPSNNNDADLRWAYYGYGGTPQNYIDGWNTVNQTIFDDDWRTPLTYDDWIVSEDPSFIELDVSASWNGTTIDVSVDVNPLANISSTDLKLHIAVAEKSYTDVAGWNGETEWFYVMRKMLPDGTGTPIGPLTQYSIVNVNESYSFSIGNVTAGSYNLWEGLQNTQIVVFVQDDVTKEVYQSTVATDWTVDIPKSEGLQTLIYPNPANDVINVDFNADLEDQVQISITDIEGRVLQSEVYKGINKVTLAVDELPAGIYLLHIQGEGIQQTEKIVVN